MNNVLTNGIGIKEIAENVTELCGVGNYNLSVTLDCGQAFRFLPDGNGFSGVAFGRAVKLSQRGESIVIEGATAAECEKLWLRWLALDTDWDAIRNDISSRCAELAEAGRAAGGIRILAQEPWEAIGSFIISQNNNIPKIRSTIEKLCRAYGEPAAGDGGKRAFPTPDALSCATGEGLRACGLGYRADYIVNGARAVLDGLIPEITAISDTAEAAERLKRIRGIGDKVAACILLFGFRRYDAFPRDVWIKRAVRRLFGDGFDESALGRYAGVAQQYLFYNERFAKAGAESKSQKPHKLRESHAKTAI